MERKLFGKKCFLPVFPRGHHDAVCSLTKPVVRHLHIKVYAVTAPSVTPGSFPCFPVSPPSSMLLVSDSSWAGLPSPAAPGLPSHLQPIVPPPAGHEPWSPAEVVSRLLVDSSAAQCHDFSSCHLSMMVNLPLCLFCQHQRFLITNPHLESPAGSDFT